MTYLNRTYSSLNLRTDDPTYESCESSPETKARGGVGAGRLIKNRSLCISPQDDCVRCRASALRHQHGALTQSRPTYL